MFGFYANAFNQSKIASEQSCTGACGGVMSTQF
jgi:hypothetical protein